MKPEDKKVFRFERKKHKRSLFASYSASLWLERRRLLGGGLCVDCQLALGFILGKRQSNFFLLLPFANLIRHFWAAGASLFTDECLLMHFLQMLLWMFFPAFSGKIYSCKLNSCQGKL